MKIVIFGLTITSSWGNGHATLWRGLYKALVNQGHRLVFFERNVPYYAAARDWVELPQGNLVLYEDWPQALRRAQHELSDADVAIVSSYCPDALAAADIMLDAARPLTVFYDLDTPVTLAQLSEHGAIPYIGARGLEDFDLVLSYTGGAALDELRGRLGARRVGTLYGHVDPQTHCPVPPVDSYRGALSYLGTYAADRQAALEELFVEPARRRGEQRFVIGGAQYPREFPWSRNIYFVRHLPPSEHAAFFSSSRLTLNVTRAAMAAMGWCPSGRLFEAAACGTAVLTDPWEGLDAFYAPEREILVAKDRRAVLDALDMEDAEIARIARAARERTLEEHTSAKRAAQLVAMLETHSHRDPRADLPSGLAAGTSIESVGHTAGGA